MKKITSCLFLFLLGLTSLSGCSSSSSYVEANIFAFDTNCYIRLYNTKQEYADAISDEFAYLSRLCNADANEAASSYNTVYTLNTNANFVELPDELIEILQYGLKMKEETDGYFNIFTHNLNTSWKEVINASENQEEKLKKIFDNMPDYLQAINDTYLNIDGNKAQLVGDETIDLGGLAKGYALRWAKNYLEEAKIDAYLINMGHSSIGLGKTSEEGTPWTVNLTDGEDDVASILLSETTLGVSGSGEQSVVIQGKRYSHIINPKSGEAEAKYHLAAAIGNDPLLNDVLSTTFYLLPKEEAASKAEHYGVSYFLFNGEAISYSDNLKVSSSWPSF